MPPASNQLCSWNDIAAEVAAGRMVWSGSAQSGANLFTWSQFTAAVVNDGTNPSAYASNQIAPYSYLLARAIVVLPPTGVTAADVGGGELDVSWTAPSGGLTPTSYDYQYFVGGAGQTVLNTTGTSAARSGYTNGQLAKCQVRSKNGTNVSTWVMSNTVTMAVGGG